MGGGQDEVVVPSLFVNAPIMGATVRMSRFEHVEGCRVCEGLYKHYTYPNGKTVHFYHDESLHELLVDTSMQLPDPPTTLESIFQLGYPAVEVLGVPRAEDIPSTVLPPVSKAAVPDSHTLPVASHNCSGEGCGLLGVLPDDNLIQVRRVCCRCQLMCPCFTPVTLLRSTV